MSDTMTAADNGTTMAPTTGRNLRVKRASFGSYKMDDVIPRYEAQAAGDLAEHIRLGTLVETDDPVNVSIAARPEVQTESTVNAIVESNKLRRDVEVLTEVNRNHEATITDAKKTIEALKGELAPKVLEIDRLNGLLKTAREDNEKLAAQVKEITAAKSKVDADLNSLLEKPPAKSEPLK